MGNEQADTLVLILSRIEPQWGSDSYTDVYETYQDNSSKLTRIARRFSFGAGFVINRDWKKRLHTYDLIVIEDMAATDGLLRWLTGHKAKDARVAVCCLNRFSQISSFFMHDLHEKGIELWTYNKIDAEVKHSYYFNQFHNRELFEKTISEAGAAEENGEQFDAAFIGANKGREEQIRQLFEKMDEEGLHTWCYAVDVNGYAQNRWTPGPRMTYPEYLKIASRSKAIVDLVTKNNYGLTWRPIEALFLQKKLITNYKEIVQEPFYRKENIYILGEEDSRSFTEFLETDGAYIPEEIKEQYDFRCFCNRIRNYCN